MSRSFISKVLLDTACAGLLVLTACADNSGNTTSYSLNQQKMASPVTNWQSAAADMWQEVSARLDAGGYHETQIAIEPREQQTPFTQALDNFLFTEAVDHGMAVTPDSPFTVTYDTQIIHHASGDDTPEPLLTPGIVDSTDSESGASTELVLNVSVTDGNSVRIRESRVFNVADGDLTLYQVDKNANDLSNKPLVSSNWYSDNPHDVLPIAMHEDNQFAIMVDRASGPVHDVGTATTVAAKHCASLGMAQAKYISQAYPTNDRTQLRVVYECM